MSKHSHCPVISSPMNVDEFPTAGWVTKDCPICTIIPVQVNNIIDFDDYYFLHERVLCTHGFSITAVSTTIDDDASPPGSTELDDETGHNCQMPCALYSTFCALVLGLPLDSWANCRSESVFAICSSKILKQFFTTMWLNTPYNPANLSHSLATILTCQEFLPASQSF
jgi:hypothetical protein